MPLPPGPPSHPLLQTRAWVRDTFAFLDGNRERFGHTFTMRLAGYGPITLTGDPALTHAVFTGDPEVFLAGKGNAVLVPFLGERSLLTMDGARHARDRKLMMPPFHGQRMRAYGRAIEEATRRVIAGWRPGEIVATQPHMQAATLEIILRAVFGLVEPERLEEAKRVLASVLDAAIPPLFFLRFLRVDLGPWSPWGRFVRRKAVAERLANDQIARRRADPGEDILSLLLAARDENGVPLTDEELFAELMTLLVAGHETTAGALAWALGWVAADAAARERLVAEIDGAGDAPDDVAGLPFLGAFCNEVLRVQPVFPIVVRILGKPWTWKEWSFSPGDGVAPCVWLTHTRPDLYPEPHRFRPERFLERKYGPTEFLPFGGGVRRCIGAAFALYEMKLTLATILRTFRIEDAVGRPRPERRNLAFAPADGGPIRIGERRAAG